MRPEPITFEPLAEAHFPMLRAWLGAPHVREWWGEPDEEIALMRSILTDDDGTEGFVVRRGETPVGYIQSWRPRNFENTHWMEDAPWLAEVPADTVGIDIFVGPAALIEKGLGALIIRAFAKRLFEAGAPRLLIDPDPANTRAVRAYEKAGFRVFERREGDKEPVLLMELKRDDFLRIS